ncbi:MAG: hypothetical protein JRE64_10500 [Deltaproteobacteria bacterium]|nr:hypothetical protein [Deltaproteobacteria bacterium]
MSNNAYNAFLHKRGELLPVSLCVLREPPKRTPDWVAVWTHEYFHFLQLTGTKFGRQLVATHAFLGHSTGAMLRNPDNKILEASNWYFPIFLWCEYEPNSAIRDSLKKRWARIFNLVESFKLDIGIYPLGIKENRWPSNKLWNYNTAPPKTCIFPEFSTTNWPFKEKPYIGTMEVMETAAAIQGLRMQNQVSWPSQSLLFGITEEQRQSLKYFDYRYSAGLLYIEECSHVHKLLAPSVCVLAADIALDSGLEDLMSEKKPTWEDWYPGWRFVKAVKAIEELIMKDSWPEDETSLHDYYNEIRQICGWKHTETAEKNIFHVFSDKPSDADLVRQRYFSLAEKHRAIHLSLWSIGSRDHLLDASLDWFRPPLVAEFDSDKLIKWDRGLSDNEVSSLWSDTQLNFVALQLLTDLNISEKAFNGIECFNKRKIGGDNSCKDFVSCPHYFPSDLLPSSCELVKTIKQLAGEYWSRLKPADAYLL